MKTLVIGGSGFIGSHLVQKLSLVREHIYILDHKKPSTISESVSFIHGDFNNQELLHSVLEKIDEVINLAYSSVPNSSFLHPYIDMKVNVLPIINFFETCLQFPNIKKIIQMSSGGTIYGEQKKLPIYEDFPKKPISAYGISKLTIEMYASIFWQKYQLPVICLRPGNAYGLGQKAFTGQGLIATALACALEGKKLEIYGKDCIRDYVYIDDLVTAIIATLENGEIGQNYNVGTGIGTSNQELVMLIEKITSKKLTVTYKDKRPFDVSSNILNSDKINRDCGWSATISLKDGIQKAFQAML